MRLILPIATAFCCFFAARGIVHYFQLESYQFPGYRRTLFRNKKHSLLPGLIAAAILTGLLLILKVLFGSVLNAPWYIGILYLLIAVLSGLWLRKQFMDPHPKKKFVLTGRVKRLYCVFAVVMLMLGWSLTGFLDGILTAVWPVFLPAVVALAGLLAWPVEKAISECYFRDARRRLLSDPDLVRIGITGSYGKTTVKHILGTLLNEKYPTLITPASFNTPMGVTRAIREHLTPSYQIFVGEMGARHVGDIKEMCRLVRPTIGIITSVGPQHLETFKTLERIKNTKYELIDALPSSGSHAYFPDDGGICLELYNRTGKTRSLVGIGEGNYDCYCKDVRVTSEGSRFLLCIPGKGEIECTCKLLGEHNIRNVLLAACVSSDLGLSLRQIRSGISKLQPVTARLELINRPGSFTVINDAFNSNPAGAKAALQVLKAFPQRRIIITPGMVELGSDESRYNHDFGMQIAQGADIAIVVGKKRVQPIIDGLKEAGFPDENIHRVDDLAASTVLLNRIVKPDDVVLYENDLPDHYQEA